MVYGQPSRKHWGLAQLALYCGAADLDLLPAAAPSAAGLLLMDRIHVTTYSAASAQGRTFHSGFELDEGSLFYNRTSGFALLMQSIAC